MRNRRQVIRLLLFVFVLFAVALFLNADVNQAVLSLLRLPNSSELDVRPAVLAASREAAEYLPSVSTVELLDPRVYVLDRYFLANNSPLHGTAHLFVKACDEYGAPRDCVVVAAIARAETDLCKYYISAQQHNCWGYGGGGANRINFPDWETAISRVTRTLVYNYGLESMNNPTLMEGTFCGDEPGCTGWGERVKHHMQQISDYAVTVGLPFTLFDLR